MRTLSGGKLVRNLVAMIAIILVSAGCSSHTVDADADADADAVVDAGVDVESLLDQTRLEGRAQADSSKSESTEDTADSCLTAAMFPDAPKTGGVFVSAVCGDDAGDGSLLFPFNTIGAAVEAANAGGFVGVGPGEYAEAVVIEKVLVIAGAGSTETSIVGPASGPAVTLSSLVGGRLSRVGLAGEGGLGLAILECESTVVDRVHASGFKAGPDWPGIGILVAGSTQIALWNTTARENEAVGIALVASDAHVAGVLAADNGLGPGSAGVAVVDGSTLVLGEATETGGLPDFEPGPSTIENNAGVGLFVGASVATVRDVDIAGNQVGGVSIVGGGSKVTVLEGNSLIDNMSFGVALADSSCELKDNVISGVSDDCEACTGHCLSVSAQGAPVTLLAMNNTLENCAGTGFLLSGPVEGDLLENQVFNTGRGGVWGQKGAALGSIEKNVVQGSKLVGIALTSGSSGMIVDNDLLDTETGKVFVFDVGDYVEMADGIAVVGPGDGAIELVGNRVLSALRAGILVDGLDSSLVTFGEDNVVAGNAAGGIVLQNGSESVADEQSLGQVVAFSFEGVGPNGDLGDIAIDVSLPLVQTLNEAPVSAPCIPPACTD